MKKSEPQSQIRKRRTLLRSEALEVRRLLAADLQITPIGEMVEVEVELATDQLQGHYHADGTYHLHPHDHESADDHDDNCSCCICSQTHSHGEYELRYNSEGLAYWFDPAPVLDPQEARADNRGEDDGVFAASSEVKVGLDQIPVLNSNPGAPHVFYLDFDGQVVSGTSWNKDNDNNAIHSLPYDLDGDPTTFVPSELDAIREIWSRVAEDYAPFEINITTEEPDAADLRTDRKALRGIITTNRDDTSLGGTGNEWSKNAGGIAFINSWTWPREEPVWAFYNQLPQTPKAVAEAIAHEFGHALGLQHDGTTASPYYRGHGDGETSWAPIMGAGYDANVTQWSRGDYDDANNRQDDISIITNSNNRITFREDDHVYGNDESTPLEIENGRIFGSGVIETATDRDTFNFTHDGGPVLLKVEPFAIGPNLDIAIELFSEESAFDPILELAPTDSLSVEISMELDAGTYFLDVDGGGHQPEEGQGFSQYGSVGQYTISGYLGTPELTANAGGPYVINEGESLVLNGSDSLAPGNAVSYGWDLDADGQFDDALGVIAELTWQQLSQLDVPINDQGSFNVALEVRDSNNISTDLTSLVVQNVAPVVEIREPESAFAGSPVQLDADATDIALDSLAYEWNLGDGTVLANDGVEHSAHVRRTWYLHHHGDGERRRWCGKDRRAGAGCRCRYPANRSQFLDRGRADRLRSFRSHFLV